MPVTLVTALQPCVLLFLTYYIQSRRATPWNSSPRIIGKIVSKYAKMTGQLSVDSGVNFYTCPWTTVRFVFKMANATCGKACATFRLTVYLLRKILPITLHNSNVHNTLLGVMVSKENSRLVLFLFAVVASLTAIRDRD